MDDNNGGANNSKAYIRALSELYPNCTLLYPKRYHDRGVCFIPKKVKAIPVYDKRSKIQKGLDIYRGILTRMPYFIEGHLINNKYDIIFIDHSKVACGLFPCLKKTRSKIVTIHHNDETQYLRDNKPGLLYRYPQLFFATRAERETLENSDLNITLTELDARAFKKRLQPENIKINCVGTFQYDDLKPTIEKSREAEYKTFAITGSLNFPQSAAPVVEFIKRYYPILLSKVPEAKLIVAGRNPSKDVMSACREYKSIELIANPDDMREVISKSDVYLCPIDKGSGVKLRVMDGLLQGLPVLAHEVSVNGYEQIVRERFMFGYRDEISFEESLESLLRYKRTPQEVYHSFYTYFSFEAGKNRLANILNFEGLI